VSLLLRHNPRPTRFDSFMERQLTRLSDAYGRLLRWLVTARAARGGLTGVLGQARWLVLGMMLASGVTIALVWPHMRHELSPLEDRGTVLVSVNAPDGATIDYTNRYAGTTGGHWPRLPRVRPGVCQHWQPHGVAGQRDFAHRGLGRARTQHVGAGAAGAAACGAGAGGECLCQHAAVAGPGLSHPAPGVRHPNL